MNRILADVQVRGFVRALRREMQTVYWADFWEYANPVFVTFDDIGLSADATDREIWLTCQDRQLILLTDNRNKESEDSLEATIREHNTPLSLPVFTIGDLPRFRLSKEYAQRVIEFVYRYLIDIDGVRGTGRLYLP